MRTALHEWQTNIRIENADGVDVTSKHIESPSNTTPPGKRLAADAIPKGPLQRVKTMHDAIERIARHESDLSFVRSDTGFSSVFSTATRETDLTEMDDEEPLQPPIKTEQSRPRPLVITDNKQLRAKADDFGAAALAAWMARRWLIQGRKNSAARSQHSTGDMDVDTPAPEVAVDS